MARDPLNKVTLLTHEFNPTIGGAGIYVEEVARAASAKGYEVTVWAPEYRGKGNLEIIDQAFPFKVKRIKVMGTQGWGDRVALARTIMSGSPPFRDQILHIAEPGPLAAMLYLQWFPLVIPRRMVLTFHGSDILNNSRLPHRRILMKRLIHRADRVSVLSRHNQELIQKLYPEAAGKVQVTFGAPRPLIHETAPTLAENSSSSEDVAKSQKVILLTVGRIHPRKGQQQVIEALAGLPEVTREKIEYWIAGPVVQRSYMRKIQSLIDQSGIQVRLFGAVNPEMLHQLYEQAHIFVMASIRHGNSVEGLGLSYLEASAHGLPVVGFHTGGVEDAIRHEETGFLVPAGQVGDLRTVLARLIAEPQLRQNMGAHGREFVKDMSWEKIVDRLYSEL